MLTPSPIVAAVRAGALYQRLGEREISVVRPYLLTPAVLAPIQQFRGAIYELDGPIEAVKDGANVHLADRTSAHIVLIEGDRILGTARYERLQEPSEHVELGGFVVEPGARPRATLAICLKVKAWAAELGDKRFIARASVEHGSASILKKFGGRVVAEYFEPTYRRHVELIEIRLP